MIKAVISLVTLTASMVLISDVLKLIYWTLQEAYKNKRVRKSDIRDILIFGTIGVLFGVASFLMLDWEAVIDYAIKLGG